MTSIKRLRQSLRESRKTGILIISFLVLAAILSAFSGRKKLQTLGLLRLVHQTCITGGIIGHEMEPGNRKIKRVCDCLVQKIKNRPEAYQNAFLSDQNKIHTALDECTSSTNFSPKLNKHIGL